MTTPLSWLWFPQKPEAKCTTQQSVTNNQGFKPRNMVENKVDNKKQQNLSNTFDTTINNSGRNNIF